MLAVDEKITVKEFLQMDFEGEDTYYELINVIIVRKSATTLRHQETSQNINFELIGFVRSKKLGKVFTAPTDVYLDEHNHVMPDIFFVSKKNEKILDYKEGVVIGVPDLIIEILSPSTMGKDRFDKKKAYKESGVKEYWIVDPNNSAVEIHVLEKGQYEPFSFAAEEGVIKSKILDGFELDVKNVFAE